LVQFPGTDTHGLKAFTTTRMLDVVRSCHIDGDVFASELVVRAHRNGLNVVEIPVIVAEKRPPSVALMRRVPAVLRRVAVLTWAIRVADRSSRWRTAAGQ
jgi:hypothetical protein